MSDNLFGNKHKKTRQVLSRTQNMQARKPMLGNEECLMRDAMFADDESKACGPRFFVMSVQKRYSNTGLYQSHVQC